MDNNKLCVLVLFEEISFVTLCFSYQETVEIQNLFPPTVFASVYFVLGGLWDNRLPPRLKFRCH